MGLRWLEFPLNDAFGKAKGEELFLLSLVIFMG